LADIDVPEAGAAVAEEVAAEAMKGQEEVEKKEPAPMSRKKKREREFTTHQFASAAEQIIRQPTEESRQEDVEGAGAAPEEDKRVVSEVEGTEARQLTGDEEKPQAQEPVRSVKVGRNDPCPCGSGKKYKKCCGRTEDLREVSHEVS
jgi:uncharacterized protein YecA (UPF0149 family)